MSTSTSIEQQHQEFKRQISTQDTYPCFLLDQTFQQRILSPTSNVMPSFLSTQTFSPLGKSPIPTLTTNTSRLSTKQSNQYRLFPSSPLNSLNTNRTNTRSTTQIVDVPIEKTIVPLRTMTDLFPSFSYTNMKISNKKSSNFLINTTNQISTSTTGVSIFGFRNEDLELIIQQFQDIGQIEEIQRPLGCENGNFLNIIYTNHVSYQNALNRNGIIFNGYMIGVVPLINK
ncbi:unnamed protein product [Rotaria sordida]|uniref:Nucleoporin NUP35 n=1 Tax=Rotaria sordida TaxID=392033 RepID=A0A814T973_9BILA|nr:unnamed protein product [Rotaria sordida]CAF1138162.1 unnamed protein product [Rotaria sordida]CAF1155176.1 unnamed protein product [Rotaria sordida]CAF1366018.1 unnamed protein product [Rotaria sordida]CAF3646664.1 unnamed protein product [Rotaria sordida]